LKLLVLFLCCSTISSKPGHLDDRVMHPHPRRKPSEGENDQELTAEYWNEIGLNTLKNYLEEKLNTNIAKNVIIFMGDGMSVPTLAATRVYMGNENAQLSFEKFPHTAVSKASTITKRRTRQMIFADLLCQLPSTRLCLYRHSVLGRCQSKFGHGRSHR
jgi:hypothetical protein